MKIWTSVFIVFILHWENVAMGCKKTPKPPPKPRCKLPLVSRQVKETSGSLICSGHADPYYNIPQKREDIAAQLLAKGGVIQNGTLVFKEELVFPRKNPETSECHVICPPGFIPAPSSSTYCSAGVWTQDPATMLCAPSPCGVPTVPQHGKYSCFGNPSTCYLTWEPGYATMSNTTITCQDGSWDVDPSSIQCEVAVALLIGGIGGGPPKDFFPEWCQTAAVFSPEDEACSSIVLPPLLIGVIQHTSHLLNGQILLCGGYDCGRMADEMYSNKTMYNETKSGQSCFKMLDNNTWSLHSVFPEYEYRRLHMGAIQQNKLQLIDEEYPTLVLQEKSWNHGRKPSLPPTAYPGPGRPCSIVTSPVTFIVIGGSFNHLSDKKMSSVLEFNTLTGEWQALPDLPIGRYGHACAMVTTKSGAGVMVVGGYNFQIQEMYPLESAFLLDLSTMIWYPAGNLSLGRESMGLVALGEKIMVLGSYYFSKEGGNVKEEAVEEYVVPCPSLRECSPSQQGSWNVTDRIIKRRTKLSVLPVPASRFNCTE